MKTIIHVDMNSYFAAVEQQANPYLRGAPVGVLKAEGRTCIIAASKEAKKYGVKTGADIFTALRLCPRLALVPSDMDKYLSVTKKLIRLLENITPLVEVFSIDEMFLDVSKVEHLYSGGPLEIALEIKHQIKFKIGEWLTCNIGISYNKILAKLAGEQIKPDGLFVIDKENLDFVLERADFADVCGIGPRIQKRLLGLGITNLVKLRQLPREVLVNEFGDYWTKFLLSTAWGEGDDTVTPCRDLPDPKSVSRTYTLYRDTTNPATIKATLRNLCEEVAWKLREFGSFARCFGLSVRGEHLSAFQRLTTKNFIDHGADIYGICMDLLSRMDWHSSVRFMGVWASLLSFKSQISIFPESHRQDQINTAMDRVNNRFGYLTLYPANMMHSALIRPEPNGYLGDKKFILR